MGPLRCKHAAVRGHWDGRQTNCRGRAAHAELSQQRSGASSHNINFKQSFKAQGLILCGEGSVRTATQSRLLHGSLWVQHSNPFSSETQTIRAAATRRYLIWLNVSLLYSCLVFFSVLLLRNSGNSFQTHQNSTKSPLCCIHHLTSLGL